MFAVHIYTLYIKKLPLVQSIIDPIKSLCHCQTLLDAIRKLPLERIEGKITELFTHDEESVKIEILEEYAFSNLLAKYTFWTAA